MHKGKTKVVLSTINNYLLSLLKRHFSILILCVLCFLIQCQSVFSECREFDSSKPTNNPFELKSNEFTGNKVTFCINFQRVDNPLREKSLDFPNKPESIVIKDVERNKIYDENESIKFTNSEQLEITINNNNLGKTEYPLVYKVKYSESESVTDSILIKIPSDVWKAGGGAGDGKDKEDVKVILGDITNQLKSVTSSVSTIWTVSYFVAGINLFVLISLILVFRSLSGKEARQPRHGSNKPKSRIVKSQKKSFLDSVRSFFSVKSNNSILEGGNDIEAGQEDSDDRKTLKETSEEGNSDDSEILNKLLESIEALKNEIQDKEINLPNDTLAKIETVITNNNKLQKDSETIIEQIQILDKSIGSFISKILQSKDELLNEAKSGKFTPDLSDLAGKIVDKLLENKLVKEFLEKPKPDYDHQSTKEELSPTDLKTENRLSEKDSKETQTFESKNTGAEVTKNSQYEEDDILEFDKQTEGTTFNRSNIISDSIENAANDSNDLEKSNSEAFLKPEDPEEIKSYPLIVQQELEAIKIRGNALKNFFLALKEFSPDKESQRNSILEQWKKEEGDYENWLKTGNKTISKIQDKSEMKLMFLQRNIIKDIAYVFGEEIINNKSLYNELHKFLDKVGLRASFPTEGSDYQDMYHNPEKNINSEVSQDATLDKVLSPCIYLRGREDPYIKSRVRLKIN